LAARKVAPSSITAARLLAASFATAIAAGTVLLHLPLASTAAPLTWVDALFTATSATCVTGLIVVDTATRLSGFGQTVVLVLLQIGGLGIMTLTTMFAYFIGGRVSIRGRELIEETLTGPFSSMRDVLRAVLFFTVLAEGLGTLLLASHFAQRFPLKQAIWLGTFHAISAFCNAGFSLFSDSLMHYAADPFVNLVVMTLIVTGGLGFLVVYDLAGYALRPEVKRLSFHTRLVLRTTFWLVLVGTVLLFVAEIGNILSGKSVAEMVLVPLFQSVTARTAGFNTVDIASLTNASLLVLIVLMFIGASPGSCGGGIKTTTFATITAVVSAHYRNHPDVVLMQRRVRRAIVSKALIVFFFAAGLVLAVTFLLLTFESRGSGVSSSDFVRYLFEAVSAFGTVGLSTGVTPTLTVLGKLLITLTMFVGRLGPVTAALIIGTGEPEPFRYPEEHYLVG